MKIIPYVTLNGDTEAAISFYQKVFGGKVEIMRFDQMPPDPEMSVSTQWAQKVMHGSLKIDDDVTIYFSDTFEGMPVSFGDSITIHLEFDSEEKLRTTFNLLVEGGRITMPVDTMFWGAIYGSLVDKFGIPWGLHFEIPA
jgi:PhnB protein